MPCGIRAAFNQEFDEVRSMLFEMSVLVDFSIKQSISALMEQDMELANLIIRSDEEINRHRFQIEEACLALIATQQPAASDLREIIAILYMIGEVERVRVACYFKTD